MQTDEIRSSFLAYFEERGHRVVPSSPVVPLGDPTLLFTNAGMNQFKDVFLGLDSRNYRRACSAQKCIRAGGKHNDLEQVGHTARHMTFFEMLGNFSFGDYFKAEAIAYAWEYLTEVLGLERERLWVSVFTEDEEAAALWQRIAGLGPERIARLGEKDNFWQMADTGPCGPCTEIHYDRGPQLACGPDCGLGRCGCDRFMEVWNLVFMQYDRQPDGRLVPLPRPSVDTGMGLERLASIVQGVPTNFDIDVIRPLCEQLAALSGVPYLAVAPGSPAWEQGVPHRVIADHVRALCFAFADGALPANEGAGYVLRRILRRAARFGRKLGIREPFLHRLVPQVAALMGGSYPELREREQHVAGLIRSEEESFGRTLDRGLERFERVAEAILAAGQTALFPGEVAFELYDTYGFPPDLTRMLARERGLRFDEQGFARCLQEQRERSRAASAFKQQIGAAAAEAAEAGATEFLGWQAEQAEGRVVSFDAERGELVLDRTPFYPEGGGQVGDRGTIEALDGGWRFAVTDTQKLGQVIVHRGTLSAGRAEQVRAGTPVRASVDAARRAPTRRNHTATHLLHWALRQVLGEHARQAGSVVEPERLRFDVTHFQAITAEQIERVEQLVNDKVLADLEVSTVWKDLEQARREGVTALFGEKYGERVRVVQIGDGFSRELCGGTHVARTGEIGLFKVVQESAVQAGVRRLVAVTGEAAVAWAQRAARTLAELCRVLHAPEARLLERAERLEQQIRELRQQLRQARAAAGASGGSAQPIEQERIGPVLLRLGRFEGAGPERLKQLGAEVARAAGPVVGLFADLQDGRLRLLCACSAEAIQAGCSAAALIRTVTAVTGGGGGGREDFAQAGGRDPSRLEEGIAALRRALEAVGARA
ncbi:MAG: alanine--tRNA ligase [Planctomycetota bacterium]|nr:MAG: alanine--tRNA ligase [Planctomycetota bacterium]